MNWSGLQNSLFFRVWVIEGLQGMADERKQVFMAGPSSNACIKKLLDEQNYSVQKQMKEELLFASKYPVRESVAIDLNSARVLPPSFIHLLFWPFSFYSFYSSYLNHLVAIHTYGLYKFKLFLKTMSDFSLTTFASKGKLPQIENALAAVAKGETSLGIKAKNGVVIATEKKLASTLMDESSYSKTQILCEHIGAVYSGLGPDFRILSQKSRKLIQNYYVKYFEPMAVQALCRETSELIQEKTQAGGYRPFGISVLVAGYDEEGPHLTQLDPSGAYYNWKATAVGKGAKNAKTFLQKRFKSDMEIEDAIHTALMTLKENFEGQMDNTNIEVGVIREDKKFHILSPSEIKEYLDELQ